MLSWRTEKYYRLCEQCFLYEPVIVIMKNDILNYCVKNKLKNSFGPIDAQPEVSH